MKKLGMITFLIVGSLVFLGGGFFIIYQLIATHELKPPKPELKLQDQFTVRFKIKNNFLLSKNIIPDKIVVKKKIQNQRLIDIIFEYRIPIYRFQPLAFNKLQQIIYQDIIIQLEPFLKDIVKVYIADISVDFLRRILNLESKILEDITEILATAITISERFQILKQYLIDNNIEKYYQTIVQIICI